MAWNLQHIRRNPVSCAVGLVVLDVVRDEKLQENARRVGDYWISGSPYYRKNMSYSAIFAARAFPRPRSCNQSRDTRNPQPRRQLTSSTAFANAAFSPEPTAHTTTSSSFARHSFSPNPTPAFSTRHWILFLQKTPLRRNRPASHIDLHFAAS